MTRTEGGLRVYASVLSAEDSVAVYGVPLAQKGIQPVWIEVQNDDPVSYFLMSPGLDPNFFPASEAAEAFADSKALVPRTNSTSAFAVSPFTTRSCLGKPYPDSCSRTSAKARSSFSSISLRAAAQRHSRS